MSGPLPIDELLEPLVERLAAQRAAVVEAPPGAGKTTRVPRALLEAGFGQRGEIWVTEPRRVAARLAAGFVAAEMGSELGDRVGYSVRFEEKVSARTELRFVTEGVLLKRLARPGGSRGLGVVVLDEFHERHVTTDLVLMLLRRELQTNPELCLIVMSATLDGEAISRHLGGCPRLRSEGRLYPIELRHQPGEDDRPLELRVASAVKDLLREQPAGDVLVFLPGAAEIQRAESALASFASERDVSLVTLHGEMPLEAQARALARGPRRKVVLATNVAESSITVEGVTAVVDSGLARIAVHSPWTGRQSLEVRPIAQASAIQRAGRAGRTEPGRVVRLYTKGNFESRPAREKPEIQRLDLAEPLLTLYGADYPLTPESWLDAPADAVIDAAERLLERLGLARGKELTPLGRRALGLSLHPRLARVVLEGEALGIPDAGCLAAALLSERDIRERSGQAAREPSLLGVECDVDQLIELFRMAEAERFNGGALRRLGLHAGRVAPVRSAYQQLRRELRASGGGRSRADEGELDQRSLSLALLAGFPDRVARRRQPGAREVVLATGHVAQLSEESVVRSAQLLLAVDVEDRKDAESAGRGSRQAPQKSVRVRLAAPLEAEWLLDHAAHEITEKERLEWDAERERAWLTSELCWGAVVLEQSTRPAPSGPATAALVERAALAQQANLFGKADSALPLLARCELLARFAPGGGFSRVHALGVRGLLALACQQATSLEELRGADLGALLEAQLSPAERAEIAREAPEQAQLARGRRVRINYVEGQAPWIESRLQDFFGMRDGPRVASGRVPLTLHLLAPNQRAVQVTTDLAGFWERHYPALRRELMRRYPRHAWPEDPFAPPEPGKR